MRTSTPASVSERQKRRVVLLIDPEPVVHEAHAHAVASAIRERRRELATDAVIADEVVLEVDLVARAVNRFQPGGIVLRSVFQQANAVAGDQGAPAARVKARSSSATSRADA